MHARTLTWLALSLLLVLVPMTAAQVLEDRPQLLAPKQPPSQKELDQRASLHQYVLGLLCQREDRLIEALKAFETAAKLDPQAPAVFRGQVPLLIAVGRATDAVAACKAALALDPDDFETWFLAARVHKSLGQFADAQKCLERGLAADGLKEHPHIAQGMWLDLATMHELVDEIEPAIKAFTAAAAILDHPDAILEHGQFQREAVTARAAETYERLGNLYRKAKKYPEAIAAYQKAQQRSSDAGGRLNFNLAQLCVEQDRPKEALDYVDAYLRRQPLGTEAYELKIDLLQKLQRSGEILAWLEQASAADPHNRGVKLLLAKQHAQERRLAQAEKVYLALAEESPTEEVYQGLFRVYQQDAAGSARTLELLNRTIAAASAKPISAQSAQASSRAKAMIAAVRDDAALAKDLVSAAHRQPASDAWKFETVQLLAALAERQDMVAEAERFYRLALKIMTPASEPLVYGGLLRALWKSRKYDEVLQVCKQGLAQAKETNHVLFHIDLAKAQARLGRHDDALRAADSAVTLAGDQDRLALQLLRIRVLTQAERYGLAEKDALALLAEHTKAGEANEIRYTLSNVYNSWKKMAQCEEQLEAILKADPVNATASNDLGYIWADQGKNLEQAEEMIRKALELDRLQRRRVIGGTEPKDNAAYVDSLGWVLFRRGKIDDARRELERAAALPDGDDPVIWDHLGDVYRHLQMMTQARTAWEKAVQLYDQERRRPMDERYRELRKKLESITAGTR